MSVTQTERAFVALGTQHAMCMKHVARSTFPRYLTNFTFKKKRLNIKRAF